MVIQQNSPRAYLETALAQVTALRGETVKVVDAYQDKVLIELDRAGADLNECSPPLAKAVADTAETDVSSAGTALQKELQEATGWLNSSGQNLAYIRMYADQQGPNFGPPYTNLGDAIARLADRPLARVDAEQARSQLESAYRQHQASDRAAGWAENRDPSSAVYFASQSASEIAWDTSGTDVSGEAQYARENVSEAERTLSDRSRYVGQSRGHEADCGKGLGDVEHLIRQALQKLA